MTTTTDLSLSRSAVRSIGLRPLLRINAAFSAVSGVVAALATDPIARALDLDASWIVRAIGVALVVYAVDLVVISTLRPSRLVPLGRVVAVADALWVLGTAALVAFGVVSAGAAVLLGLVAVPVGALAVGQWRAAAVAGLTAEAFPLLSRPDTHRLPTV